MAIVTTDNAHYGDIAAAIREKAGGTALYKPSEMAAAIRAIQTSGGGASQIDSLIDRTITEISNDRVTDIGPSAFRSCSNLTTVNFPAVTSIGTYAFNSSAITSAYFPVAKKILGNAFSSCTELTSVNFPVLIEADNYVFQHCKKLMTVKMPALKTIGTSFFEDCPSLLSVDLPAVTKLSYSLFYGCSNLNTLILRSEMMVTLINTGVFTNTPIKSGSGYIYVPAALVDSYKAATNWSVYADQIRAIEDYPDITGGAA